MTRATQLHLCSSGEQGWESPLQMGPLSLGPGPTGYGGPQQAVCGAAWGAAVRCHPQGAQSAAAPSRCPGEARDKPSHGAPAEGGHRKTTGSRTLGKNIFDEGPGIRSGWSDGHSPVISWELCTPPQHTHNDTPQPTPFLLINQPTSKTCRTTGFDPGGHTMGKLARWD